MKPELRAEPLTARLMNFADVVAQTALDLQMKARDDWRECNQRCNDCLPTSPREQRLIYVPLTGEHVGACGETRLEDGKVLTAYRSAIPGVWELSVNESEASLGKQSQWLAEPEVVAKAMLLWDGVGEMPGGDRCGVRA